MHGCFSVIDVRHSYFWLRLTSHSLHEHPAGIQRRYCDFAVFYYLTLKGKKGRIFSQDQWNIKDDTGEAWGVFKSKPERGREYKSIVCLGIKSAEVVGAKCRDAVNQASSCLNTFWLNHNLCNFRASYSSFDNWFPLWNKYICCSHIGSSVWSVFKQTAKQEMDSNARSPCKVTR